MKVIYKYQLHAIQEQAITMPKGSKILSIQIQFNEVVLWAEVDKDKTETEERVFIIETTGNPMSNFSAEYLTTLQLSGGSFVAHIYELK